MREIRRFSCVSPMFSYVGAIPTIMFSPSIRCVVCRTKNCPGVAPWVMSDDHHFCPRFAGVRGLSFWTYQKFQDVGTWGCGLSHSIFLCAGCSFLRSKQNCTEIVLTIHPIYPFVLCWVVGSGAGGFLRQLVEPTPTSRANANTAMVGGTKVQLGQLGGSSHQFISVA